MTIFRKVIQGFGFGDMIIGNIVMALVNYLWLILMNVDRTSHFWRTFGSWLTCMESFLSFALCKWHGFTMLGGSFKLIWSSFCSQGAAVEQWRLLALWRVPVKKYLNLLWAWMGHGLSRCFPFSNKSFYRLTLKAHFLVLLVVCNKYALCVYMCVFRKVMYGKPIVT
jgi:hypothetical protein